MPTSTVTDKMPEQPAITEVPERFLKLTEQIMKKTSEYCSRPLEFNDRQCRYLAGKLKVAVDGADKFLRLVKSECKMSFPPEDTDHFLENFKLLYAFATEAMNFVRECCKEAWMQAAMELTNMSEHVSSIGFNLELCAMVFSDSRNWGASESSLSLTEKVEKVYNEEVEIVREHASTDKDALLEKLEAHVESLKRSSTVEGFLDVKDHLQLASRLLKRLQPKSVTDLQEYEENSSSMKEEAKLGKGAFGIVYKATWYGIEVAKKRIFGQIFTTIDKEVFILAQMSHPNVASLFCYAVEERQQSIVIATKLMEKDLRDLILERLDCDGDFPFAVLVGVDIMLQVASGMYYVHELKIGHHDLKAENILVRHVAKSEYVLAEISDFGVSKMKEREMTEMTPNTGTLRWKAPELIKPAGTPSEPKMLYDEVFIKVAKCDVYSFAMLCYEILTGCLPFNDISFPSEIKMKILEGERPKLPQWCPNKLKSLIERCWTFDPNSRPLFGDICGELRCLKYELLLTYAWGKIPVPVHYPIQPTDKPEVQDEIMMNYTTEYLTACWESVTENERDYWSEIDPLFNALPESDSRYFAELKDKQARRIAESVRLGLGQDVPGFFRDMDDLVLGEKIAKGGQAIIYEAAFFQDMDDVAVGQETAEWRQDATHEYVAKVFRSGERTLRDLVLQFAPEFLTAFDREVREGSPLSLFLGGTLLKDGRLAIVTRRMWGDLRSLIGQLFGENLQGPPFTTKQVLQMMLGIAKNMMFLHNELCVLHRDLKAANVLVGGSQLPSLDGGFEVIVTDYEASRYVQGTGFWRAPEILADVLERPFSRNRGVFSRKSDVYSYGMTCYELATGHTPFVGYTRRDLQRIIDGERPHLPRYVDPVVRDLITSCWHPNPLERPSFFDIVKKLEKGGDELPAKWVLSREDCVDYI